VARLVRVVSTPSPCLSQTLNSNAVGVSDTHKKTAGDAEHGASLIAKRQRRTSGNELRSRRASAPARDGGEKTARRSARTVESGRRIDAAG